VSALAERLLGEGRALSQRVLDTQYRDAFWGERFGTRGRRHADEDSDFHLQYLARALEADDGASLVRYACWLRELLASRGMCTRHLDENFRLLAAEIEATRWPGCERAVALLAEARDALRYTAQDARWIQEREAELGAAVADSLRARFPRGWKCRDARGADGLADDAANYLSYIADALALKDPRTLVDHTAWLATHLESHGVPAGEVRAFLDALREALAARGAPVTALDFLRAASPLPLAAA
jgi:hypothetical protein